MVANAADLLRLILTYCLGQGGLRSAVAIAVGDPPEEDGEAVPG